ncbi:pyrroline-5-carboxylate reductase family protein [Methanoplanus limicola]|uniref:Pyrroline-5-carboxylate reductase n=1 Tax=Methanoplanus limicola DSM 2279 TaxID=937775 RepID=H1Z113_9EURY|nr:pyrroline-5-carboxylate reductase [Methanoplanus limicola]EHQ34489.1 NADP oxidoreductase coenzyme F420-dependent [Methanoplanus limicola DSM 2279]
MPEIGVIGTGSMGKMLIRSFIKSRVLKPGEITASNRTEEKLLMIAEETGIKKASSNRAAVRDSDIIFLCVVPDKAEEVISEIRDCLTEGKILVSAVTDLSTGKMTEWIGRTTPVARVIPSVTSNRLSGVSVLSFDGILDDSKKEEITKLFSAISKPVTVPESEISAYSDIASSSPAFIAGIMKEFSAAAVRYYGLEQDTADMAVREAFTGTAKLIEYDYSTFDSLIADVATEGGITGEGIRIIRENAGELFSAMLKETDKKHKLISEKFR